MMQTIKQITCPRCNELNYPQETHCIYCGALLRPPGFVPPRPIPAPAAPPLPSDLVPLLWTLICLFVALWGMVIAGPLRGFIGFLTHPASLIVAATVALVFTGLYLSERMMKEPPPRALLTNRDLMVLAWTGAALLGVGQGVKLILPPLPVITSYQPLPKNDGGCRVEVSVRGREGDELWRLTELNKRGQKVITGVIVRRAEGGSVHLPLRQHTAHGDCAIVKYHLLVDGKEVDNLDGSE